ncbi:MAG: hypothetical protein U0791_26490 [Gemmataceae bacterium]
MSTLVFKKPHPKYGPPNKPVDVPFLEARELVSTGVAVRWNGGNAAPAESPPTVSQEAHERAGKRILELEQQIKDLQDEVETAAKASQKATAEAERLAKENATLTDQLNAARAAAGEKKK